MDDPFHTGLPSEQEMAAWANAFFKAGPNTNDAEAHTAVLGGDNAIRAARDVAQIGSLAAPPSAGGIGLSPGAVPTNASVLSSASPGVGVPPLGLVSAPGINTLSPGANALSPQQPGVDPTAGALYILAEARPPSTTTTTTAPHSADWLTPRADLMPGYEDLARILEPDLATSQPDYSYTTDEAPLGGGRGAFDVEAIRRDFPILKERINGRSLVWFDNGATTQKPQVVIDRIGYFYAHENSNVHRGAHTLAARATDAYENARKISARFINASGSDEIVFTRGTTEAINLVSQAWGWQNIGEGDEIVISHLEHHANIVPWQQVAAERGARVRVIPVDDSGRLIMSEYARLLNDCTKIVSITHVSNALGTVVPIKAIIDQAHAAGAKVLIDAAQSIAHARIDVQALDADFLVFSGHKIYGPTGIGVLYGKRDILNHMLPWQGGGNMIEDVTFEQTRYQPAPARFEAGTGNLADAVGLGAALDYVDRIGLENIARYEHELLDYATAAINTVPGLTLFGPKTDKVAVLSFHLDGYEPEELGSALDKYGIAVRAGHHCAQPILRRLGVEGTVRAVIAVYNTRDDVDRLIQALRELSSARGRGKRV
ncbi:MAG: cysteine desulfurase [Alphaproteobacteria bacterium]